MPIRRTSDALDGFYTLNGTAATIWELASDNRSAVEMAGVLSERYTVSEADAVEDVLRILRELEHIGALQRIA
ncbi:MAG TPA: PqqD family protein [Kiritimatiellia bacterium]|nr:PqqD family protein [Kiritimatiellia bacterium]